VHEIAQESLQVQFQAILEPSSIIFLEVDLMVMYENKSLH